MLKISLLKFNSNLAVSIAGAKRENFKKGTVIAVARADVLPLMRLGCSLVWETMLSYKEHKKFLDGACESYAESIAKDEAEKKKAQEKEQKDYQKKLEKDALVKAPDSFFKMVDSRTLEQLEVMVQDIEKALETKELIDKKKAKAYIKKRYEELLKDSQKDKSEDEESEINDNSDDDSQNDDSQNTDEGESDDDNSKPDEWTDESEKDAK